MKTKPILFNTNMVKAILNGTKTQTRRTVKFNKEIEDPKIGFSAFTGDSQFEVRGVHENGQYGGSLFNLPFTKNHIMWVRETVAEMYDYEDHPEIYGNPKEEWKMGYWYKTDGDLKKAPYFIVNNRWKPSIFMPKEACRLFLKISRVRIERLQDISEEDAKAEGILSYNCEITKSTWYKDYLTKEEGYGRF